MNPAHEKLAFPGLTPGETFVYKWRHGLLTDHGEALVTALIRADSGNLDRYALGFPVEVAAVRSYWNEPGWWPEVQRKAKELIARMDEAGLISGEGEMTYS